MLKIIAGNMIARLHVTKQRGQVALLYALIVPVMIFCVGVALDLGWYYLNVSRLQNAADSAVLAGASKLIESNAEVFDGYTVKLVYEYPADKPYKDPTTSTTKSALKSTAKSTATIDTTESDQEAATYTLKNLSSDDNWAKALVPVKTARASEFFFSVAEAEDDEAYTKKTLYTMNDNWSHGGNPRIMMTPSLYQDEEDYYYVVQIQEDIRHFFIGFLGDMEAPVVAVALISKGDTSRTIEFNANGGKIVKTDDDTEQTSTVSTSVDDLLKESESVHVAVPGGYSATPVRDGYTFTHWNTKADGTGKIITYGTELTEDTIDAFFETYDTDGDGTVTLFAQWTVTGSSPLTINFNTNANDASFIDSTKTDSKEFKAISDMEANEVSSPVSANKGTPKRTGYVFKGWNTKADGTGTYIYDGKQLSLPEMESLFGDNTSITLYAQWDDPLNNKTLWEQMEYVRAKFAYESYWTYNTNKYGVSNLHHMEISISSNLERSVTPDNSLTKNSKYIKDIDRLFLDFHNDGHATDKNYHTLINVNVAYDVRDGKNNDPLYVRIESEPIKGSTGNSPQQIIININASNLADGKRPLFIYYDGPEEYERNGDTMTNYKTGRNPRPVILNLNADFKGVLYMPNIPVVINGNGKGVVKETSGRSTSYVEETGTNHVFEGFIIAKEYLALDKTSGSSSVRTHTSSSYTTTYKVDSNNNVKTTSVSGNYLQLANKLSSFYLDSASKFRKFKIEDDLDFMYIEYDIDGDMVPLVARDLKGFDKDDNGVCKRLTEVYEEKGKRDELELIPLYDANGKRINKWSEVKLYDKPADDSTRTEIPKKVTEEKKKGIAMLNDNGKPIDIYDEYGNQIYFSEDYGRVGKQYDILTLLKVDSGLRTPHEFLLTQPESNTDDWI